MENPMRNVHWQLPNRPVTDQVTIRDLGELVGESGWGQALLVDLPAGHSHEIKVPDACLIEIIEGNVVINDRPLQSRTFSQFPAGTLKLEAIGSVPARLIIVAPKSDEEQAERQVEVKTWPILQQPLEDRPKGIQLRSLWKVTNLPQTIGYEWVEIEGLVKRHDHADKDGTGSFALVYVISGNGQFGYSTNDGPGTVYKISPGSVVIAEPEDWHGFYVKPGERVTIVSLQLRKPITSERYRFADDQGVPEFSYEP